MSTASTTNPDPHFVNGVWGPARICLETKSLCAAYFASNIITHHMVSHVKVADDT